MRKKDEILDQLLRNQDVDKPSADFTNDVVQMISDEFALSKLNIGQPEQAPRHVTDLVMEEVISPTAKTYDLLSFQEKRSISICLVCIIILCVWASLTEPTAVFIDTTKVTASINTVVQSLNSGTMLLLIGGTSLWIVDKIIRKKLRLAN